MVELGVNIDHVATLRQARRTYEPDPVWAAALCELHGADSITVHLREDRRHIQDRDVTLLRQTVSVPLNLEMACTEAMFAFACELKPEQVTLVPENRAEVTTEGGLDAASAESALREALPALRQAGIRVSLFLDPEPRQIEIAAALRIEAVELHTGSYALARGAEQQCELERLRAAGALIRQAGMLLHAGHGLNYTNVGPVAAIEEMRELNIGHAIISRAVFVGLGPAVAEMKRLIS